MCSSVTDLVYSVNQFNALVTDSATEFVITIASDIVFSQANHDNSDYPLVNNSAGATLSIHGNMNTVSIESTTDFNGLLHVTSSDMTNVKFAALNLINNSGTNLLTEYGSGLLVTNNGVNTSDYHSGTVSVRCCSVTSSDAIGTSATNGIENGYMLGAFFSGASINHCKAHVNISPPDTSDAGSIGSGAFIGAYSKQCSIKYSYVTGVISSSQSGGFVGKGAVSDSITECYFNGTVADSKCSGFFGNEAVGNQVLNCYFYGDVTSSTECGIFGPVNSSTNNNTVLSSYHRSSDATMTASNIFGTSVTISDVAIRTSDILNTNPLRGATTTAWAKVTSDYPLLHRFQKNPWTTDSYSSPSSLAAWSSVYTSDSNVTIQDLLSFYGINSSAPYTLSALRGLNGIIPTDGISTGHLINCPIAPVDKDQTVTISSAQTDYVLPIVNQTTRYVNTNGLTLSGNGTARIALEMQFPDGSASDIYSTDVAGAFTFKQKIIDLSQEYLIKRLRFYTDPGTSLYSSASGFVTLSNAVKAAGLFPVDTIAVLSYSGNPLVNESTLATDYYTTSSIAYTRLPTTDILATVATDTTYVTWSDMVTDAVAYTDAHSYTGYGMCMTGLAGEFEIACFGSAGTGADPGTGGAAGYITAKFELQYDDVLYAFIGTAGDYIGSSGSSVPGGWNGGGNGGSGVSVIYAGGGGGATDIRLNGTSLADRIIVAGGGGGAGDKSAIGGSGGQYSSSSPGSTDGSGGYYKSGGNGTGSDGSSHRAYDGDGGGLSGGTAGDSGDGASNAQAGGLGYGGNAATAGYVISNYNAAGGGGSGYYGGGGAADEGGAGGGGSSWAGGDRLMEIIATDYAVNLVPTAGNSSNNLYSGSSGTRSGEHGFIIIKRVA